MPTDFRVLRPLVIMIAAQLPLAQPGLAQRAEPGWDPAPLRAPLRVEAPSPWAPHHWRTTGADSTVIPPTYWLEGGAIGGGLAGIAGGILAVGLCGYDSPCHNPGLAALGGFLIMGVVGFGVGALIGGLFPKP